MLTDFRKSQIVALIKISCKYIKTHIKISSAPNGTRSLFAFIRLVRLVAKYAVNIAVENIAQIVERHGAYRLVVLEAVYKTAADIEIPYQPVCRHTPVLHSPVKRLVSNHKNHPKAILIYAQYIDNCR